MAGFFHKVDAARGVSGMIASEIVGVEIKQNPLMQYDLGYFDLEQKTLQPPITRLARNCNLCLRYEMPPICPGRTG
jgi:hypothetical protein